VTWRGRYAEHGLAALEDLPRPGKPAQLPEQLRHQVLELTLTEPPDQLGATHGSSRLLATALAGEGTPISHATIAQIWHRFGVQPWRAGRFSSSPPRPWRPRSATSWGCTCIRRRRPWCSAWTRSRRSSARAHRSDPAGAARAPGGGQLRLPQARHHTVRHQEFLAFLKQVAAAYLRRALHVVVDNLSTHKHPAVRAWLERHPRVQLHFTPTSGA
jgi:homeodomain-containing protein/DDE superfamily endonuclease